MADILIALCAAALIVIGIAAEWIVSWLGRRQRAAVDRYDFLSHAYGFELVSDRFVADHRILRYSGQFRGTDCHVEIGFGPGVEYGRIDFEFERALPIGLRISSEHEESAVTRVMRLREMNIGLHHFDSQFLLLARNEERAKQLLDHDVRRMLVSLRSRATDVRLDDVGLNMLSAGSVQPEPFGSLLEEGAQLTSYLFRLAEDTLAEEARVAEASLPAFTPIPGTLHAVGERRDRT